MKNRLKVLWLTNIPSPYRVDFFNEFGKYCDLTVLFEKSASAERNKSWQNYKIINFKAVFLKGISVGVAESICPGIIKYLNKKKYDKFFVTNYSDISGILAIAVMKIRRISYIIEGDGAFEGSGDGIKEKLKKWIISDTELCFSTSEEHDKYYKRYGAHNIIRYPFTSVKESELWRVFQVTDQYRSLLQKLMDISEKNVLLFYGNFLCPDLFEKNVKTIGKIVNSISCQTAILLIGKEFYKGYIQWEKNNDNIYLLVNESEYNLAKYYAIANGVVILNKIEGMKNKVGNTIFFSLPVILPANYIKESKWELKNIKNNIVELDVFLDGMNYEKKLHDLKNVNFDKNFLKILEKELCLNTDHCIWNLRNIVRELEKKKLGISEHKLILSVGQFIYRKGYDILIKSAKQIEEKIGIYIVGGTPSAEYLEMAEGISNIHFVGFKTKTELFSYYIAADLFVLPTREDIWGLVINEAMAFMLPIITTNRCIAGLELVSDNGFIVECEDSEAIAQKVNIILENPEEYSINSFKNIQNYTIEKMATKHVDVLLDYKQ